MDVLKICAGHVCTVAGLLGMCGQCGSGEAAVNVYTCVQPEYGG